MFAFTRLGNPRSATALLPLPPHPLPLSIKKPTDVCKICLFFFNIQKYKNSFPSNIIAKIMIRLCDGPSFSVKFGQVLGVTGDQNFLLHSSPFSMVNCTIAESLLLTDRWRVVVI